MEEMLGRSLKRGDLVCFQAENKPSFGIILDKSTIYVGFKVKFNGTVLLLNTLDKDLENVKSNLYYKYTMREKENLFGEQKPGDVFLVHKTSQGVLYDYYLVYLGKSRLKKDDGSGYLYRHLYYKLNFLSGYREFYVNTIERTVNIDLNNGSLVYQPEIINDLNNYLGNFELLDFDKFKSTLFEESGDELNVAQR